MTFLYFLPGVNTEELTDDEIAELLVERGMDVALKDCLAARPLDRKLPTFHVANGPDGSRGTIVAATPEKNQRPPALGYFPDRQEWEDCGRFWLGIDKENPPTPAGVRRQQMLVGYEHRLGDGNKWVCPVIRRAILLPTLPQSYGRDADGNLQARLLPEYDAIWHASQRWAAALLTDEDSDDDLTIEERFDACCQCLGLHYRLGSAEISRLGLLNDRTLNDVLDSALDIPWLIAAKEGDRKKKHTWDKILSVLQSSTPGPEDSTPTIAPAEPTKSSSPKDTDQKSSPSPSPLS